MDEQRRVRVDRSGVSATCGGSESEVVHRLVELRPLPQTEMLLGSQHQAGAPQSRGDSPRRYAEEWLVKGPVEGPDLQFPPARVTDSFQVLAELGRDDPCRRCCEDIRQAQAIDREGFGRSSSSQKGVARVAERAPADDPTFQVPPRVSYLNNPVGARRSGIMAEPRRLSIDDYNLPNVSSNGQGKRDRASPHARS